LIRVGVAGQEMLRERDKIVERCKIGRLPVPALASD
jgi:hypothetical protein